MKILPITRGTGLVLVDDDDYPWLAEYSWYVHHYAMTVFRVSGRPKFGLLHRIIMNAPSGLEVDHIDGNRLNNQKSNLRLCTHAENQKNRTNANKNNHSGAKGVYFDSRRGAWYAQVNINGKEKTVASGLKTIRDAVDVRNRIAMEFHGEFYAPSTL